MATNGGNSKPPVILIHGMWSQPDVWQEWVPILEAAGYRCQAVRLPGHHPQTDDSPTGASAALLGLQNYVETVTAVAEAVASPPILIGHSLGGLVAQQVAAQVTLSAVVLVNSAAPGAIFPLRPIMLPGIMRHFLRPGLYKGEFKLSRAEAGYLLLNRVEKVKRAAIYQSFVPESGRAAWQAGFGWLNLHDSNGVDKSEIHCPLLALAGDQDHIIPIAVSRKMAKWYGDKMDYREHPDHAHWLLAEPGWEAILQEIIDWLP